jgi:hypothetical protein
MTVHTITKVAKGVNKGLTNRQEFISSGQFIVPAGVTVVYVTVQGAGGSGGAQNTTAGGRGGNGGDCVVSQPVYVREGEVINVTIGAGGAARSNAQVGIKGGDSSFGGLVAKGGQGGKVPSNQTQAASTDDIPFGGLPVVIGGTEGTRVRHVVWDVGLATPTFKLIATTASGTFDGGDNGINVQGPYGYGGGASYFGRGGKGGDGNGPNSYNDNRSDGWSPLPEHYGAGGGGAGSSNTYPSSKSGRGGHGFVAVSW